jgi:hypothetical protein
MSYYKAAPPANKPVARRKKTILHQEYDGSWTTHTASMVFPSTMSERDLWEQLQAALKEVEKLKKASAPVTEVANG